MCISQVLSILTNKMWMLTVLMPVTLYYLALKTPCKLKKKNIPDLLMICIFITILVGWMVNDFSSKGILIFRFIITQGAFMATYYIGRNCTLGESYKIFYNALLPGFICAILGLVLYIYQPAWYMAQVKNVLSLEALRLRSIFPSPYTCSYLSFFLVSFLIANDFRLIPDFKINISKRVNVALYVVFIILLLFCMMRAPIAGVLISTGFALCHSLLIRREVRRLLKAAVVAISVGIVGLYILDRCMDSESRDFLIGKILVATDRDSSFIEARYELFVADETFWGDGAGRHAIYADDYGSFSVRDTCYQRLKQEVGIVGLAFHLALFIFIISKCIRNYKSLTFELSVMLFLMFSMIGADPLGTPDKHSLLYWLIIGRVASFGALKSAMKI